jgi:acetoacetyl-CoA reductase
MDKAKFQNFIDGHALVVGGTGAIGEATVLEFAEQEGVKAISITYWSNEAKALELQKLVEAKGLKFYAAKVDLLDSAAFREFMEAAVVATGYEINAYANASGVSPNPPLESLTLEDFYNVYKVNVIAVTLNTRDILARAVEKGVELASVLVTSTNGDDSYASFSVPYDQTKAALVPTIKCLAKENATKGIRVNGVSPGWVFSPMNATVPGYADEIQRIWRKRDLDVREVARVIVWLCSRASSGINGVNLKVDGGYN